jgi:hypothetical protein
MDAVTYARGSYDSALGLVGTCAGGMTDEQYNYAAGGTTNTPAKSHIHALTSVEFFVVSLIQGGKMQWPEIAAANGLPANPMEIWAHAAPIPQAPINDYAARVKAAVMSYLDGINDAELDRKISTQFFGEQTVAWILQLACYHAVGHAGDMAAVKGVQGLKGLPF